MNVRVSPEALELADSYLNIFGSWETSSGSPMDRDSDVLGIASEIEKPVVSSVPLIDPPVIFLSFLRYLGKRNADIASGAATFGEINNLVEVFSRDDQGNIERSVSACIYKDETGVSAVPLAFPADKPIFLDEFDITLSQRISVLTELVRVFGNLVSFGGLSDGLRSDAVGSLRNYVRALRQAVRLASKDDSGDADTRTNNPGSHANDAAHIHTQSIPEEVAA